MVQSGSRVRHPSVVELARKGDQRAIAAWINRLLLPYGIRAYIRLPRPGYLKILVEFQWDGDPEDLSDEWSDRLIRFICHHICRLNSSLIEGVRIAGRFVGDSDILWERSIRIITSANRARRQHQHLRSRIRNASKRKTRLRMVRSFVTSGPAIAALIIGGILGYAKAPINQTGASASLQPKPNQNQNLIPPRPDTVRAALETIPVIKHNQVANPSDPSVSLLFSGDVTLADHFQEVIGKDYEKVFAKMDEYRKADLAMVNLENPLTRSTLAMPDKQFNFKADPDSVKVLTSGGVDLVTIANNHSMDYQAEGLKETMDVLDKAGIQHIGAGNQLTEARRPDIFDVKGQRIAYLAYYGDEYGAEDNKAGVSSIKEERIAEDIKSIRDQVDWIVVNFHWGQELATHPADWQTELGRFTIDQGADLVVGHHPHVLQGAEIYRGRPIVYSLGNFIFGGNPRTDYDTAVLKVALKDKKMKVEFLPVEVKGYQPQVVSGDRGNQILQQIEQLSASFKQPMKTAMVLDARTLPAAPNPATPTATSTSPVDSSLTNPQPSDSTGVTVPTSPAQQSTGFSAPPAASSSPLETSPSSMPATSPMEPSSPSLPAGNSPDAIVPSTQVPNPSNLPLPPEPTTPDAGTTPNDLGLPSTLTSPADSNHSADSTSTAPDPATTPVPAPEPALPSASQPSSSNSFTNSPNRTPITTPTIAPSSNTPSSESSNSVPPTSPNSESDLGEPQASAGPQLPPRSMLQPRLVAVNPAPTIDQPSARPVSLEAAVQMGVSTFYPLPSYPDNATAREAQAQSALRPVSSSKGQNQRQPKGVATAKVRQVAPEQTGEMIFPDVAMQGNPWW
ncbi:MAG TPA: CapA family protein [Microcoleaceae cyanobacterium]|jgi:poly-gamma-glutamate synthesis protein (capsule biosynthesis protein)